MHVLIPSSSFFLFLFFRDWSEFLRNASDAVMKNLLEVDVMEKILK